jgi:hypothetical protein
VSRVLLGGLGVLATAYGVHLLLVRQDHDQLADAALWLAAGVLLHDAVLAPVVLVVALLAARLPLVVRGPAVAGAVVLGSVTLAAVPVLGRFGARRDNPTLLDRDYAAGWLVLAALVLTVVGVAVGVRLRGPAAHDTLDASTEGRGAGGPGAGG